MSSGLLTVYHITKLLPPYRKSRSLNTMVTAALRSNAELMLVLRMHTKEISKSQENFMPIEK